MKLAIVIALALLCPRAIADSTEFQKNFDVMIHNLRLIKCPQGWEAFGKNLPLSYGCRLRDVK